MSEAIIFESDESVNDGASLDVWHIDNDQLADWTVRKIVALRSEENRMIEWYRSQMQAVMDATARKVDFFEGRLREYMESVPVKETKTQISYALPSGKLVVSKPAQSYVHDDAAIIEWCRASNNVSFIKSKTVESLDWSGLKKAITTAPDGTVVLADTGELVPGATSIMTESKFKVV